MQKFAAMLLILSILGAWVIIISNFKQMSGYSTPLLFLIVVYTVCLSGFNFIIIKRALFGGI